jgi:glycosyltransferase involved in cell wall biosynthesis
MVAALSSCDAVLAVSSFVARKFVAMGVEGAVVRELAIGTRMVELAAEYRARGAMEEPAGVIGSGAGRGAGSGGDRPLTLAFLGYHNFYKGLHVLTDAVALLDEATARRVALVVHAKDVDGARPTLAALAARCASVVVEGGYEYARVPEILGAAGVDVGVVPSVWWDNGPQTVMEYLACGVPVLGAAVGGIPDVVREGENGLLFRGGDAGDLARRIAECVGNREMVAGLKARVAASRGMLMTMGAHCARLEEVYGEVVSRGWRGREGA